MRIVITKTEEGTLATASGRLDSVHAGSFLEQALPAIQTGKRFQIDLAGVPYASSAGLRVLVLLQREIAKHGAQLEIVGLQPQLRDIMISIGFDHYFKFVDQTEGFEAAPAPAPID
jgi:anti-sigma B factor antagonist